MATPKETGRAKACDRSPCQSDDFLVVMPSAADVAARSAGDPKHRADHDQDKPDEPSDRHGKQQSEYGEDHLPR